MTTRAHAPKGVTVADDYTAQLEAGMELAARFYASGRRSLVAAIPTEELVSWDGSDELAIVSDPDGIELSDLVLDDAA